MVDTGQKQGSGDIKEYVIGLLDSPFGYFLPTVEFSRFFRRQSLTLTLYISQSVNEFCR